MTTKKIMIRLREIMKERGLTQQDLADISGVRRAFISEMCTNARTTINRKNLAAVMDALDIKDVGEILVLVDEGEWED